MHVRYDTKDIPMPLIGHPRPPTPFSGPIIKDRIGLAMANPGVVSKIPKYLLVSAF